MNKKPYDIQQLRDIKQLDGVMIMNHKPCSHKCGSSDAMSIWQKEYDGKIVHDAFCYSCAKYVSPNQLDIDDLPEIDVEEIEQINTERVSEIAKLPVRGWRERCVTKNTSEFYGVRSELDADGKLLNRYYPVYQGGELVGYKARNCVKKGFWAVGRNNVRCEMFGQSLFPKGGRKLVICGGEEDAMSAFQMLSTDKYTTSCISPTVGEGSCANQIKNNFEYISSFKEIILMLDNDEAGKKATAECVKLFRPDQVTVWKPHPNHKDVNDYLVAGEKDRFKNVFFNTHVESPAGIIESNDDKLWEAILERASSVKIPLPPFAEDLEKMLRGGPALGEITLLCAASSIGKTSLLNAFTHFWIFNAPYKVGIISLESDLGEFGENLLSLHIQSKLANMYDEEKQEILAKETTREQYEELTRNEDGDSRFILLDHQSSIMDDELKRKIEFMVKVKGCKIIILDPLTLALSGQGNDGIDLFNAWYLRFVKREQIAAFNVLHVRKNGGGQKANSRGGEISEEDIKGCLDADTEFLSPEGWVKISEWSGEHVMEYSLDDHTADFAAPLDYVKLPCETMYRFHNQNTLDMVLSNEHRILFKDIKGEYKTITTKAMLSRGLGRKIIPTTFGKVGGGLGFSDEYIRVLVMVAADGCYHGNGLCKISFVKERKKTRCKELLDSLGVEYSYTNPKGRPKETVFRFKALTEHKHLHLAANWYQASAHELSVLLDECLYWDGHIGGDKGDLYTTTIKGEADVVQYAGAVNGRTVRINERSYGEQGKVYYQVAIPKKDSYRNNIGLSNAATKVEEFKTIDGFKYCFTTSTGFFVARRNGKVFVTGNSSSLFQTAMNVWILQRDKYSECPVTRNTTKVVQSKARRTGNTGTAGYWFYNNDTGLFEKGINPEDIDTKEDDDIMRMLGAYDKTSPDDFLKDGGY